MTHFDVLTVSLINIETTSSAKQSHSFEHFNKLLRQIPQFDSGPIAV